MVLLYVLCSLLSRSCLTTSFHRTETMLKSLSSLLLLSSTSSTEDGVPVFIANPPVVVFAEYTVGQVYEVCVRFIAATLFLGVDAQWHALSHSLLPQTTLELKNMTSASRHVRVIPPTTPHFSIGLGKSFNILYTVFFIPFSKAASIRCLVTVSYLWTKLWLLYK